MAEDLVDAIRLANVTVLSFDRQNTLLHRSEAADISTFLGTKMLVERRRYEGAALVPIVGVKSQSDTNAMTTSNTATVTLKGH